jgi:hypothetical protein
MLSPPHPTLSSRDASVPTWTAVEECVSFSGHGKEPLLAAVSIEPPRLDIHLGSVAVARTFLSHNFG